MLGIINGAPSLAGAQMSCLKGESKVGDKSGWWSRLKCTWTEFAGVTYPQGVISPRAELFRIPRFGPGICATPKARKKNSCEKALSTCTETTSFIFVFCLGNNDWRRYVHSAQVGSHPFKQRTFLSCQLQCPQPTPWLLWIRMQLVREAVPGQFRSTQS